MNIWVKTDNDHKMKLVANGQIVVVSPVDVSGVVPLFCPCCERPMKTLNDGLTYRKLAVCHMCDERWTNKPGVKWPQGPDKTTEEWKQYLELRSLLEKPSLNFK